MTHFVAESVAQGKRDLASGYATMAMAFTAVVGVVLTVGILATREWLVALLNVPEPMQATAKLLFPGAAALSVFTLTLDIEQAHLAGLGRADLSAASQLGGRLLALVLSAMLLATGMRVWGLFAANVVAAFFTYFLLQRFILQTNHGRRWALVPSGVPRSEIVRNLLSFGTGVAASSSLVLLLHPLNKYALGRQSGLASVSIYEIAVAGNMQLRGLIEASIRPLLPEVSATASGGRSDARRNIRHLHRKSLMLSAGCGTVILTIVAWKAPFLLSIWLGNHSSPALVAPTRLYALAAFVSLLGVPAYYSLLGLGAIRSLVVNYSILAVTNCVVLAMCGFRGVLSVQSLCVGMVLGHLLSTIHLLLELRRRLKGAE